MAPRTLARWVPFDSARFAPGAPGADGTCSHPGCGGPAVVMRGIVSPVGPSASRHWVPYCRSHGAMYGVLVRRGALVTRLG